MQELQEIDLIVACFEPSVAAMAKSNMEYLKSKYFGMTDYEKLLKIVDSKYELISQDGYTDIVFKNDLISLGYTPDIIGIMLQAYEKMRNYTEDELHAVKTALSNVITNEAINKCQRENFSSPIDFVRAIQGFNVDNIQDVDKRIYREFTLFDIDVSKLKAEVVGSALKSSLPMLNSCSPLGGYLDRTLTMVSGKPGCFFGWTRVRLCTGEIKSLRELYDSKDTNIPVYSMNPDTNEIIQTHAEACILTKSITEYAYVGLRDETHKWIFPFNCTIDHQFLIRDKTTDRLKYVEAKDLKTGDEVIMGCYSNQETGTCIVGCVSIKKSQQPIPVFDLVNAGPYHNFAIHGNKDWGVFVHNSGKSMLLTQEACEFARQGKKVLYLALGDMNEYHFVTRIFAQQYRVSMNKVALTFDTLMMQARNDPGMSWIPNLKIQCFQPDQISCTNWISFIKSKGFYDEYDVFIADYDSNFSSEEDMYQKGETTYNQLKGLSDRPGKWVFIACQPKPNYYSEEILPLESGNESSRKQQIVDNMITVSFPPIKGGQNHIGIINVPKYRGGMLASTPYLMDKNGRFEEISMPLYSWLKICPDPVTLPGSGCSDMSKEIDLNNIPQIKK